MSTKSRFGYGDVIYNNASELPLEFDYGGCHWYRTAFIYNFRKTGMTVCEYDTYDRKEDLRLYMDAAGNIWDEKEHGIL